VAFFRVRQLELVGLKYLAPEQILREMPFEGERHLFDPTGDMVDRASAIPGVADVKAQRRLPGTLRLVFTERLPVAFAPNEQGLLPLDARGRPLPYDPAATGFDLPIVPRADTSLVRTLAQVRMADSVLFQQVDAARRGAGETVILELGRRQVLLRAIPTRADIRAVELVRRHLTQEGQAFDALDARFEGRIFVRRSGG
jgi:cell division protein FtsQ